MPARDRTGPLGLGSMTGRGMGLCNPHSRNVGFGRFSGGRGNRRRFFRRRPFFNDYIEESDIYDYRSNIRPETEKEVLKEQIKRMKTDIEYMTKRMEELENVSEKDE